jgi:hypothetical protein
MRYTVFSIDDRRKHYTDKIHYQLASWERLESRCVNGTNGDDLRNALSEHLVAVMGNLRVGHLGIWLTVLNALKDHEAPFITFEDDSILNENFISKMDEIYSELPEDCDFLSLFMPMDYADCYHYGRLVGREGRILADRTAYHPGGNPQYKTSSRHISKAYQRYGGVSMLYTAAGAAKILDLVKSTGFTDQYDDYLYKHARMGNLNGYTVIVPSLVYINGN